MTCGLKISKPIKNALRIVTGCLCPTPTHNLFIFAGVQPTELCRQKAVRSLARRSQEREQLLYERLLPPLGEQLQQLKSRQSFVPAALELLNNRAQSDTSVARWAEYK